MDFDQWLFDKIEARDLQSLFEYSRKTEHASLAHPTDEHLMPLYVSMGAGWSEGQMNQLHNSFSYGNLSMTAYAFADENILSALSK